MLTEFSLLECYLTVIISVAKNALQAVSVNCSSYISNNMEYICHCFSFCLNFKESNQRTFDLFVRHHTVGSPLQKICLRCSAQIFGPFLPYYSSFRTLFFKVFFTSTDYLNKVKRIPTRTTVLLLGPAWWSFSDTLQGYLLPSGTYNVMRFSACLSIRPLWNI